MYLHDTSNKKRKVEEQPENIVIPKVRRHDQIIHHHNPSKFFLFFRV